MDHEKIQDAIHTLRDALADPDGEAINLAATAFGAALAALPPRARPDTFQDLLALIHALHCALSKGTPETLRRAHREDFLIAAVELSTDPEDFLTAVGSALRARGADVEILSIEDAPSSLH